MFEAFETKLGQAVTAAFSNATAEFPFASVSGIYTRAPGQGVGSVGMQSREITFVCRTDLLTELVVKGTLVTIGEDALEVSSRIDWFETGDTELALELAPSVE